MCYREHVFYRTRFDYRKNEICEKTTVQVFVWKYHGQIPSFFMNLVLFIVVVILICVAWSDSAPTIDSTNAESKANVHLFKSWLSNPRNRECSLGREHCIVNGSKMVVPPCLNRVFPWDKVGCSCTLVDNKCNSTATFNPLQYQLNQNVAQYFVNFTDGLSALTGQSASKCNSASMSSETTIEGALCALGCICALST